MSDKQLRKRIQMMMPDLEIDHLEHNREGLINDVVIINHELVFRFAKNDGYAQILNLELDILDLVRPRCSARRCWKCHPPPGRKLLINWAHFFTRCTLPRLTS